MKFLSLCFILVYCFSAFSKIGYVDFDKVLQKTKEGQSVKKKLEKEVASKQGQLQKTEKKLQEERQQFESESGLLSDSEKRKRAQKLQMQFVEFQKRYEMSQKELQEYQMRLVKNIIEKMRPILGKIAKDKGFTRIDRISDNVLWVADDMDVTKSVIKAYNKKYK